jgi:hypothetical protein
MFNEANITNLILIFSSYVNMLKIIINNNYVSTRLTKYIKLYELSATYLNEPLIIRLCQYIRFLAHIRV